MYTPFLVDLERRFEASYTYLSSKLVDSSYRDVEIEEASFDLSAKSAVVNDLLDSK